MRKQADNNQGKRLDYKTVSFILLTVAFFGIFAIRPAISLIFTLQKEKSDYEKINTTLETKIQEIIYTQSQFMTLINNKNLVEEALPSDHQIEKTEEVLTRGPDFSSFSIDKIQILPNPASGINKLSFSISGLANYQKLTEFLLYLESSRRLLTPNSLTIHLESTASDSGTLNFSALLNGYYYLP